MTPVPLSLLKRRQLELLQVRANPASRKDFLLLAPGFCQVANPLKGKQDDVNRPCCVGVLGGYRLRHSVSLNRAVLAHRVSCQDKSKAPFSCKGAPPSLLNKIVYQSPQLFTYTICFFTFSYHLASEGCFIMSCCCTAALHNREALRKAGRAKEIVLYSFILRAISPSVC